MREDIFRKPSIQKILKVLVLVKILFKIICLDQKNVLRGLHFQKNNPQGKLVRCGTGTVFDVVVDIDPSSKNFLKYFSIELSDQNLKMLWVPAGYAHGFCVLSDFADFHYKCTDYYDANDQHGLIWNDKNIGIEWPIIEPIVSEKDLNLPTVSSFLKYEDNNFWCIWSVGPRIAKCFQ